MLESITTIKVRYAETDKMGYVYYGNYATFYEVGRTELMRTLGLSYKEMEDQGIFMPVLDLHCKYIRPAHYDDTLRIRTYVNEMPETRIKFYYEIFNNTTNQLLNKGETTLVFLNAKTYRPTKAPSWFLDIIKEKLQSGKKNNN